jgi:predicted nucleic acid-binding protein
MILLDTNLLARVTDQADPQCIVARRAINVQMLKRERLFLVPQNLYEFWAVATRKAGLQPVGQNGLGMSPALASQWLRYFQRRFTLLHDREDLFPRWHDLVTSAGITGLKSYDARLVAAMQCYGITRLLTFNTNHFKVFPLTLIDPTTL